MADHHYFLQYHIYTVALHRYLSCRLPGYDYDRDFGGVFYLFIKGMHPDSGPECGVYADLPPLARIEQLSEIFESLAGEGA
jgi:exodeoxyribonuclease V beta subunit